MRWEDRPNGHYCTVHKVAFARGEVCGSCVVEPGDGPGAGDVDDVHDAQDLRAMQNECESRAKRCWRVADELFEGTDRDVNAACKASAEATKWTRLALEIRDRHATQVEISTLIKKYRELLAMDGAH